MPDDSSPRELRGLFFAVTISLLACASAWAMPYIPASDDEVLAELPPGARHTEISAVEMARSRIDVALPLAQFYIRRTRETGDLRFLGYAEAVLAPWLKSAKPEPQAMVLHATILQSRHAFEPALAELDRSLKVKPDDAQAWLTRAIVLRVLGRYPEATESCNRFAQWADAVASALCLQGVEALDGHLAAAYASLAAIPSHGLDEAERSWLDSELGEMSVRLGHSEDAEGWFRDGLAVAPKDFYLKAAYADLLLSLGHNAEALSLLKDDPLIEPLLLRIAIAQKNLGDPDLESSRATLTAAFSAEAQRGEEVHRREQARFLLDVENQPREALAVAIKNWEVQREPDDVLIFVRAANAAGTPDAAKPVESFIEEHMQEDARRTASPPSLPQVAP